MTKYSRSQFMLVVLMLLGVSIKASATVYEVSNGDDFVTHWQNNDSIRLVADIDLSNYTSSPISTGEFTASLTGKRYDGKNNYYTISNIKVTLAQSLRNAYIHDVRIKDCSVQHLGIPNASGFVLCQNSYNCTFENIVLYNVASDIEPLTMEVGLGKDDASCLVGIDEGSKFSNISAFGCTAYAYNSYAGILCSESTGSTFEDCTIGFGCGVYADGTVDNSYSGGLVGNATNSTFTRCDNMGSVIGAMDCVGGIVGKGTMSTFRNCNNYGSVRIGKYGSCEAFRNGVKINRDAMPATFSSDELERYCSTLDISTKNVVMYYAKLLYNAIVYQGECVNNWWMDFDRSVFMQQNLNEESIISNELEAEAIDAFEPELDISDASSMELKPTDFDYYMSPIEAEEGGIVNDLSLSESDNIFEGLTENIEGNPLTSQANVRLNTYGAVLVGVSIAQAVMEICKTIYNAQTSDDVGGIVGLMYGGGVYACTNYGLVYSADAYAGGIVGDADDKGDSTPIIENCMNRGLVKGFEQTGGIVGRIECGAVNNCLNIGNISSGNSDITTFGRIFGQKDDGAQSNGNLYVSNAAGNVEDGCQGVTLKMLASGEATKMLNNDKAAHAWRQSVGIEYYPSLLLSSDSLKDEDIDTTIDPTIRTKNPSNFLQALACQYSDIVLTGDIDLNTSMFNFSSRYMPFYGSIDGQNHKLKNVSYVTPKPNTSAFSNDNSNTNVGFLSYARNATFKDLELNDFVLRGSGAGADTCALFVANSANCKYTNIRITGASSVTNKDEVVDEAILHVGCLVGYSSKDTFTDCWTGPMTNIRTSGRILNSDVYAGGLVGIASKSNFLRCYNQTTLDSHDKIVGGIVGRIESGSINSCVNMGTVYGNESVGGIAGEVYTTDILQSVNTGTVSRYTSILDTTIGGIAGTAECETTTTRKIDYCANWGKVQASSGASFTGNGSKGAIVGVLKNSNYVLGTNYYDCLTDGSNITNVNCNVKDGTWTYAINIECLDKFWYQDIDNNTFPTKMPVPLEAAGSVHRNFNCKQSAVTYSNIYASKALHFSNENKFGVCNICGAIYDAPSSISITEDKDMVDFSYATNNGQNFSSSTISLEKDLDLSQESLGSIYSPVGTYNHPFKGKFYGNGHHVKNMLLENSEQINGFFGCVGGNTEIDDVIIDSTSYINTAGYGAAGLIGAMTTDGDGGNYLLNINRCGNDANVTANTNAAGILGGVFAKEDGDYVSVNIDHCYNTGTIKGDKESAAICGYARNQVYLDYCWNSGTVTGYDDGYPFIRYNKDNASAICHLNHCYGTMKQTDVDNISISDVKTGRLCFMLNRMLDGDAMATYQYNTGGNAWYQQIGVNKHPIAQKTGDNLVYHHEYSQCNTPEVIDTLYNNSDATIASIQHKFNTSGICTRVEGEIHGEEPALVDGTWQITKIGNLYWIASQVNSGGAQHDCLLMNDVRDNYLVQIIGFLNPSHRQFNVWTPIGTTEHPFKKSFDGNYHNISGLYCDRGIDGGSSLEPVGLFGALQDNNLINNVGVHDCYFRSYSKVGLLAGTAVNVNQALAFYNINTYGSAKGVTAIGGLIGMVVDKNFNENSIKNSYSLTDITREQDPTFKAYDQVNNGALVGTIRTDGVTIYTGNIGHCYYLKGVASFTSKYGEEKTQFDFRSGAVCQLLNDHQLTAWSQPIDSITAPVFGQTGVTYKRNVSAGSWGTIVVPFPVTSDDNIQYYTYRDLDSDHTLHLAKADEVPANTPCFFRTSDDCTAMNLTAAENSCVSPDTFTVSTSQTSTATTTLNLVGSYEDKTISPDDNYTNYYLASNKLWWGEKEFSLPAFRSYIQVPQTPEVKAINIFVDEDGETTKIGEISADGKINFYNQTYNLNGQSVSPTTKGIIIRNGKKMLNK